jgi:hypothetical protein
MRNTSVNTKVTASLALGACVATLFAATPAKATDDPSITTVYRPSSCTQPFLSGGGYCANTWDYAQNPNTFAYVIYNTIAAADWGFMDPNTPVPAGANFYAGIAIQCTHTGIHSTGWQGPYTQNTTGAQALSCELSDPSDLIDYVVGAANI